VQLAADASPYGLGAIISHITKEGEGRPIAYASRSLTPAEKNYSVIEKDASAIIFAICKFQQFLYGRRFTLLTDHQATPDVPIWSKEKDTSNSGIALTKMGYPAVSIPI